MDEVKQTKERKFKVDFKISFDKATQDVILCEVIYSPDTWNLIKEGAVVSLEPKTYSVGNWNGMRYAVKGWLMNSIMSAYKNPLFDIVLISDGKRRWNFESVNTMEIFIKGFKQALSEALELLLNVKEMTLSTQYTTKELATQDKIISSKVSESSTIANFFNSTQSNDNH